MGGYRGRPEQVRGRVGGVLAAQFPRTHLDPNCHAGDIDTDLLNALWPDPLVPSGKALLGKSLVWRTLDDGRPICDRKLTVHELRQRIARCHTPHHQVLHGLLQRAHAHHGGVLHINCHSMNPASGAMAEGGADQPRADMVLGDRDGTTCASALTAFVRGVLVAQGYEVKINDPFKGVARCHPQRGLTTASGGAVLHAPAFPWNRCRAARLLECTKADGDSAWRSWMGWQAWSWQAVATTPATPSWRG